MYATDHCTHCMVIQFINTSYWPPCDNGRSFKITIWKLKTIKVVTVLLYLGSAASLFKAGALWLKGISLSNLTSFVAVVEV